MQNLVEALCASAHPCARAIVSKHDWTPEDVARLKTLAAENLMSASQIAGVFGVTRNAVIGKLNRLGISIAKPTTRSGRPRTRRSAPTTGAFRKQRWRALVKAAEEELEKINAEPVVEIGPPPTAIRSVLELHAGVCRYPFGDPRHPGFCYCGGEAFEGLPYCAGHARLSYRPARSR